MKRGREARSVTGAVDGWGRVPPFSLLSLWSADAISATNPRVIDDSRARKLSNDLKRCTYYETCATYGLNVERVFQDGNCSRAGCMGQQGGLRAVCAALGVGKQHLNSWRGQLFLMGTVWESVPAWAWRGVCSTVMLRGTGDLHLSWEVAVCLNKL